MNRFLLILCLTCSLNRMYSEDIIQIVPFAATANIVSGDKVTFDVNMINSSKEVRAIQFTFYLPEGMAVAKTKSGNCVAPTKSDRFFDEDDEEDYYSITLRETDAEKREYMVIANPSISNTKISGTSGVLMSIRFTTEENIADGCYPIIMKDIIFSLTDKSKYTAPDASSYVAIGESNPLSTAAHVDLSGMTGYIPSFVVNQLNTDIASNTSLKSLNLSGTSFENLGAALNVPNNNDLLWYTSDKASLNRTFSAGKWSTVCLPFALETITVNTLLNNGCAVKGMTRYDPSEKTVTFDDVNTMSTGVPYLFKCSDLKTKPFENIDITNPEAISKGPRNVTVNNLTFKGTYELYKPSSTDLITIYGYKNNQFVKVESGESGKVQPFRAYMELAGGVGTRGFISIDGLDDATGINEIVVPDAEKTTPIYDLQGRKVDGNYHSRGILIQNGKKIIKK